MSSAASSTFDSNSTKDNFIPLFSGQPSEYKEWRKRILIYQRKMVLSKRASEGVLNLIGSQTGTAWSLLEDFPLDNLELESTFNAVLKILDAAFQYDDRVQLPSDFEAYFMRFQRKHGQTLLAYCTEHEELIKRLDRHKVTLPGTIQGWLILRRAGLKKVIETLYLLFGQDFKETPGRPADDRGSKPMRLGEAACAYELFMIDDGEPIKYEDVVSGSAVLRQNDLVPENALVLAENELLADGENTIMKYDKPAGWKLILVILAMLVKPVETTDPLGRDGQCWKDDGPEDGSEFTELYWFLLLILVSWIIIDYMLKPHTRLCCWRSDWMPCRMPCRPASAMWLSSRVVRSLERDLVRRVLREVKETSSGLSSRAHCGVCSNCGASLACTPTLQPFELGKPIGRSTTLLLLR